MSPDHEAVIATFLTIDGQVFLAPQYNIAFEPEYQDGGACPDFVVLDWRRKHVVIVEVTSSKNLKRLIERVQERDTRWYKPMRRKLANLSIIDDTWRIRFLGFVRNDNLERAQVVFKDDLDVTFYQIEKASFPWDYWDQRIRDGLPGANTLGLPLLSNL